MLKDGSPVIAPLDSKEFAGPGTAHIGYGEYNQRELLNRWADYLEPDYDGVDFRALTIGGEPPVDTGVRTTGSKKHSEQVTR